jgi:hypothetical protein
MDVSIAFILPVSLSDMPIPEAPNDEMFIKYDLLLSVELHVTEKLEQYHDEAPLHRCMTVNMYLPSLMLQLS